VLAHRSPKGLVVEVTEKQLAPRLDEGLECIVERRRRKAMAFALGDRVDAGCDLPEEFRCFLSGLLDGELTVASDRLALYAAVDALFQNEGANAV